MELVMISVFGTLLMLTMFLGFIHNGNSRHFCSVFPEFKLQAHNLHHVMTFAFASGRDGNAQLKVCH
jgi:hypothetical protein